MESSLNALRFPLVALVMIVAAGCGKAPEATQSAAAPPAVSVAQVIKHQVTEWDELTGRQGRNPWKSARASPASSTRWRSRKAPW